MGEPGANWQGPAGSTPAAGAHLVAPLGHILGDDLAAAVVVHGRREAVAASSLALTGGPSRASWPLCNRLAPCAASTGCRHPLRTLQPQAPPTREPVAHRKSATSGVKSAGELTVKCNETGRPSFGGGKSVFDSHDTHLHSLNSACMDCWFDSCVCASQVKSRSGM